ncbi:MAG: ribosome silencing factor [Desulfobulbaceae bacterium]|nr:ribosome silencing factor [Desulfobulbaceae bacterium]
MKKVQKRFSDKDSIALARAIANTAIDKKAEDLIIMDVRGLAAFTDFFVIMSGRSTRHVQSLAESIDKEVSSKRLSSSNTEGLQEGQWVLLDYNDVVVHIFYEESRKFYDLEGLWHDAPRLAVTEEESAREE